MLKVNKRYCREVLYQFIWTMSEHHHFEARRGLRSTRWGPVTASGHQDVFGVALHADVDGNQSHQERLGKRWDSGGGGATLPLFFFVWRVTAHAPRPWTQSLGPHKKWAGGGAERNSITRTAGCLRTQPLLSAQESPTTPPQASQPTPYHRSATPPAPPRALCWDPFHTLLSRCDSTVATRASVAKCH